MLNIPKPILLGVVPNPSELWEAIHSFELSQDSFIKSSINIPREEVFDNRLTNFISRCLISWKMLKIEKSAGRSNYIQNNTYQKILISNVETVLMINSNSFLVAPNVIISLTSRNWCVSTSSPSRTTITGFR